MEHRGEKKKSFQGDMKHSGVAMNCFTICVSLMQVLWKQHHPGSGHQLVSQTKGFARYRFDSFDWRHTAVPLCRHPTTPPLASSHTRHTLASVCNMQSSLPTNIF